MTENIRNNHVHLCDSCAEIYPECKGKVLFGDGIGKDNICCCNKYRHKVCNLSQRDIGNLCIFAIRYCQGRESYAPDLCRSAVRQLLPSLSDDAVNILLEDCKFQANMHLWGDERIDKPGWIKWRQEIEGEIRRRGNDD